MSDSLEERRVGGRERDKQYVYISLHTMNITCITKYNVGGRYHVVSILM